MTIVEFHNGVGCPFSLNQRKSQIISVTMYSKKLIAQGS